MSGVMAGTAILSAPSPQATLGTVTVTINNTCNLSCAHCYLEYSGPAGVIGAAARQAILASPCELVCIVGKEPLANRASAGATADLVRQVVERGKRISLISNGLNGELLQPDVIPLIEWMDVSLDGGRQTYEQYRKGSWRRLERSLSHLRLHGLREWRALQTLSSATAPHIRDMVQSSRDLGASMIMFSPFRATAASGLREEAMLSPSQIVDLLAPVADAPDVRLSIDGSYADFFVDADEGCRAAAAQMGDRFSFITADPVERGFLRVTYDGLVMTPLQAVETTDYHSVGRPLGNMDLETHFGELRDAHVRRVLQ